MGFFRWFIILKEVGAELIIVLESAKIDTCQDF